MRSAIVRQAGGPEVIEIVDLETPEPAAGEILVQVAYAAMNPLDTHARANRIEWMHPGFPFTPGFEFAGRVVKVGEGVTTPAVGDRVACNGQWRGNAEFALADATHAELVPDEFSWQLAASYSTCAYTSWLLIHQAGRVQPGDVVAIHSAAGAVGALTTQITKSAGATVIALAGASSKLASCLENGADHAISYFDDDWPQQVMKASGDRGASLIIDGNAGKNALRNLECIAPLGRIIFLGATDGEAGSFSTAALIGKCCAVEGFVQFVHQQFSNGQEKVETQQRLGSGEWTIPIGQIFPLERLADAHRAFEARELVGRALIEVGGEAV